MLAPVVAAPVAATRAMAPPLPAAPAAAGGGVRVKMSAPPPALAAAAPKVQKNFSLGLGILGAFLGAAIGGALVYGFFALLHIRFWLTGMAVGALAGYGARLLARGTDTTLGYIAGALALVATAGAFYLIYLEYDTFYVTAAVSVLIGTGVAYKLASE
jgi:hypothetical protein